MHSGSKFRAYADYNVSQHSRSFGIDLNRNDLLVLNAEFLCSLRSKMYVALCSDNSLCKVNLSAGSDKLTSRSSLDISALAYRSRNSESTCVCKRNLNLSGRAYRSENTYLFDRLLRSDNRYSLLTGKLTRLAQILLCVRVAPFPKRISTCSWVT